MELTRRPSLQEKKLLELLVKKAAINFPNNWEDDLMVCSMNDGNMGSLYLFPNGATNKNRLLGKRISEHRFQDEDGIEVIASLNVDNVGDLFELDVWKTDFNPLIKLPEILD